MRRPTRGLFLSLVALASLAWGCGESAAAATADAPARARAWPGTSGLLQACELAVLRAGARAGPEGDGAGRDVLAQCRAAVSAAVSAPAPARVEVLTACEAAALAGRSCSDPSAVVVAVEY